MPQSKEVHKEYMRKRRKGSQDKGSQPQGSQDVTPNATPDVTPYHPIMHWLVDKDKRKKLEVIVERLDEAKLLPNVYYGAGQNSIDFARVSQLLEATH